MPVTEIRRPGPLTVMLTMVVLAFAGPVHGTAFTHDGVERVVAFGDVHGAYAELVELLQGTGVIDEELRWSGGGTHLVSVGDLLSRGDHGRQVLDLLMRLEHEAAESGGAVHLVLGNHEVMHLTGDLRYVSEGDYEQFGGAQARKRAFAPDGEYGRWLLDKPVMVMVNGHLFLHGGLSGNLGGMSLAEVNRSASRDLRRFVEGWHALVASGHIAESGDFDDILQRARSLADDADDEDARRIARGIVAALDGLPFIPDGPLWYRGSSLCHPYMETRVAAAALERFGAEAAVIGHTVTLDRRITSRMEGRIYRIDTGMNNAVYGGRASALILEDGEARAYYAGEGEAAIVAEPNRVWSRPYGMDDAEIERFLLEAEITDSEDVGVGVTGVRRLTLEMDGRRMRAAFKTIDTDPGIRRQRWSRMLEHADSFRFEIAAYHLDRVLGLDMVPVTVERRIDGEPGALQYWVEDAINETRRRERSIPFGGYCDMAAQYNMMNVFDVLIHNVDRNLGDIIYDQDWKLWLIDHSRSFRTARDRPAIVRDARLTVTPELAEALQRVDRDSLTEVEYYLNRRQVTALLDRARQLRRQR